MSDLEQLLEFAPSVAPAIALLVALRIKNIETNEAIYFASLFCAALFFAFTILDSLVLYIVIFVAVWVPVLYELDKDRTEREHQRILAAKRREQEQIEANRGVFNADQGFTKQHNLRGLHEERWYSDADAARAKSAIHASEYRAAETADPIVDLTAGAISPLLALQQQLDELRKELQDVIADGRAS